MVFCGYVENSTIHFKANFQTLLQDLVQDVKDMHDVQDSSK